MQEQRIHICGGGGTAEFWPVFVRPMAVNSQELARMKVERRAASRLGTTRVPLGVVSTKLDPSDVGQYLEASL